MSAQQIGHQRKESTSIFCELYTVLVVFAFIFRLNAEEIRVNLWTSPLDKAIHFNIADEFRINRVSSNETNGFRTVSLEFHAANEVRDSVWRVSNIIVPRKILIKKTGIGRIRRIEVHWYENIPMDRLVAEASVLALLLPFDLLTGDRVQVGTTRDGWNVHYELLDFSSVEWAETDDRGKSRSFLGCETIDSVTRNLKDGNSMLKKSNVVAGALYVYSRPEGDQYHIQKRLLCCPAAFQYLSTWHIYRDEKVASVIFAPERFLSTFLQPVWLSGSRRGGEVGYLEFMFVMPSEDSPRAMIDRAIGRWASSRINSSAIGSASEEIGLDAPIIWQLVYQESEGARKYQGMAEDRREFFRKDVVDPNWCRRHISIQWADGASQLHTLPVRLVIEIEDQFGQAAPRIKDRYRTKRVTVQTDERVSLQRREKGLEAMRLALLMLWASDNQMILGAPQETKGPGASIVSIVDYSATVFAVTNGREVFGYTLQELFPLHSEDKRVGLRWTGVLLPRESVNELLGEVSAPQQKTEPIRIGQQGDYCAPGLGATWLPPERFRVYSLNVEVSPATDNLTNIVLEGRRLKPATADYRRAIRKYYEQR